jgi:nicotinamidase/pyrazinamidase
MPYDLLDAIERAAIRDKKNPLEVYRIMRSRFPRYERTQLGSWTEKFFRLWCRNQWKRERYAPSFHVDDANLDPKTWCRFPILSGGFERELRELREHIASESPGETETALLIVDLQNDFCPGGALAVPEGHEIVPLANRLMEKFELILATQDWHPPGHGSFAASHPGRNPGDEVLLGGIPQTLWPVHCVQNTRGAEFVDGLRRDRISQVFHKGIDQGIDSYSCFYDNAHQRATGLGDYLKERKVQRVYIIGLATDYCVKFSALDAVDMGFETFVISDGCRGINLNPGDSELAFKAMEAAGVQVILSEDL